MVKKFFASICMIAIIVSLTSCATELHQQMIIKGIGIDKNEEIYKLSVRYATLDKIEPEACVSVEGGTVYEAMQKLSTLTGKKPIFPSLKYIICSELLAKEGLDKSLDFIARNFKAKPTMSLYICKGNSEDLLKAKENNKLIPSSKIVDITKNEFNKGKIVSATIMDFIASNESKSNSAVVTMLELQKNSIISKETAVFKDYKMIDIFDEQDTKAYLALKSELKTILPIKYKDEIISVSVIEVRAKIENSIVQNQQVKISITATASLEALPFSIKEVDYGEVSKLLNEKIYATTKTVIDKMKNKSVDLLCFANEIYKSETELWQKYSENIILNFDKIDYKLNVTSRFNKISEEESNIYK